MKMTKQYNSASDSVTQTGVGVSVLIFGVKGIGGDNSDLLTSY
jgi:hypothetical protein